MPRFLSSSSSLPSAPAARLFAGGLLSGWLLSGWLFAGGLLLGGCLVGAAAAAEPEPFAVRAVHLDNRIQVAPVGELKRLATHLSERGVNALVMEWEASFPFKKHHVVSNQYAYTHAEIQDFIEHCTSVGIDVIPLQQCIGHLEYVLRHERYAPLREDNKDISQVCPSRGEAVVALYDDLLSELVAAHPSKYVHIGADETALLGHCEVCRRVAEREGKSALFMDHIAAIAECVQRHGKTPLLWADIVMAHPEAIDKLPSGCVLVNWNYGWDVDHFGDHQTLIDSGLELWGAPAMRSHPDNFFRAAWDTHFKNLEDFIPFMREKGYRGVVLTSWSTSGVYTQLREPKSHVVDMTPARRVYPMNGFPLLLDAYTAAIATDDFDAQQYVEDYGRENYGLTQAEATALWDHLNASSHVPLGDASTREDLQAARDRSAAFRDFLDTVTARPAYRQHFEHYRLMTDIRLLYLDVQLARLAVEQSTGDPAATEQLIERLEELKEVADEIDTRFAELHHENLYPAAIEEERAARNQELEALFRRVARVR